MAGLCDRGMQKRVSYMFIKVVDFYMMNLIKLINKCINSIEMKKLVIVFVFLMLLPSSLADWFYNSQNIIASVDISSFAEVVSTSSNGYIESATVNMTFFPKQTDTQELLKFSTEPNAELKDKTLKFTWKNPEGKLNFRLKADVKTTNKIVGVKEKISFPIEKLPADIIIYTKPSETIDSNDEDIIRIASELVKGEDDLYAAVFKIADWTKSNVEYNLSTLTAEVSQKASWVLQNKQGVCDELTSLFIALLRSIGVPARFVSGIAYTNSELFPEKWGPHGWAEVYFPEYGWIPFDVTYGEYGWIDPTHLKFKESIDSDEPSTYYQWLGRNADLKTGNLDIRVKLTDKIGYYSVPLNLDVNTLKKSVGFGSYNLVEATIENAADFYYATELQLGRPKELKIIDNELKNILLLPREKKKVFWILQVDNNLESKYSYTFPLVVSTTNNITASASFISSNRENEVSLEEVEKRARMLEEEKEKKYSANVLFECKAGKDEFYAYEDVKIYCNAKNIGNIFLEDAEVCLENKCNKIDLGISQEKNLMFGVNKSIIGQREITATLRNSIISKSSYISFKVNDNPKVEIEYLLHPINVTFEKNFNVSFTISKKSFSIPKNVEVILSQNGVQEKWSINTLNKNRDFVVSFEGNQLRSGKNNYELNINYFDSQNQKYNANKKFSIGLINAGPYERLILFLNNFEGLSYETIALMLLGGTIAFLFVVILLFRRGKKY